MKKGSVKNTRINSEVQKEVANIIQNELVDPAIPPLTSVTCCDVTTDLKYCTVRISLLGDDAEKKKKAIEALNKAKGYVRKRLAETVNLRTTPELKFVLDETFEYSEYISSLIAEAKKKDELAKEKRGENNEEN